MALTLIAAENLAQYDCVYVNSAFKAAKADADAAATMPGLTLCKDAAINADAPGEFYQLGEEITNLGWSWSAGMIFPSTTPGQLTQTAPGDSGDQVQIVGFATAATKMVLWPQLVIVEVA